MLHLIHIKFCLVHRLWREKRNSNYDSYCGLAITHKKTPHNKNKILIILVFWFVRMTTSSVALHVKLSISTDQNSGIMFIFTEFRLKKVVNVTKLLEINCEIAWNTEMRRKKRFTAPTQWTWNYWFLYLGLWTCAVTEISLDCICC